MLNALGWDGCESHAGSSHWNDQRRRRLAQTAQRIAWSRWEQQQQQYRRPTSKPKPTHYGRHGDESLSDCNAEASDDPPTMVYHKHPAGIPYVNCVYLDERDTVLAVDQRGYADVVRLEPPRPSSLPSPSSTTTTRVLPSLEHSPSVLCHNIAIATPSDHSGHVAAASPVPSFALKSIRNGEAFVVGLPSGEMRVFVTERAAPRSSSTSLSVRSHSGGRRFYSSPNNNLRPLAVVEQRCSTQGNCFIAYGYYVPKPAESLRDAHHTTSIDDMTPHQTGCWDFLESSTGAALWSAHIGQGTDSLSLLKISDERTPRTDLSVTLSEAPIGCRSHALCWLSERSVATVTSSDNRVFSALHENQSRWNRNQNPGCLFKVWDIRMAYSGKSAMEVAIVSSLGRKCQAQDVTKQTTSMSILPNRHTVGKLTLRSDGQLIASSADGYEHYDIDPVKGTLQETIVLNGCLPAPPHVANTSFAVDKQNGTVAIYQPPPGTHQKHTISLFPSTTVYKNKQLKVPDVEVYKERKRKYMAPTPKRTLEMTLQDSDGLQTEISCLAFHPSGMGLTGASVDGDIFAWHV